MTAAGARVRSIAVEIDGEDGGATVVVRAPAGARAGGLAAAAPLCSCGVASGCEHVRLALEGLAEVALGSADAGPASVGPKSTRSAPPDRSAAGPGVVQGALSVLMQALLRAAAGEVTAAVDEALRSATATLATRPLPGVARVLARVSATLGARGSALQTALAITALGEVAAALDGVRGEEARAEVAGVGAEVARLDDLELVEVARARERGALCWETRILVEPTSGALYREEGLAGSRGLSAGVCGRRVVASLASRQLSREPSRVVLMQYALEPAAPPELLARAADQAPRRLALPEDVAAAPLLAVACPRVAWIGPAALSVERGGVYLSDDEGARVALDRGRDPGAFDTLAELVDDGARLRAVAGAYHVDADGVRLAPWSAIVERASGLELVALVS